MKAMVLRKPAPIESSPLAMEEIQEPVPREGEALLKVLACGVCRTDLHVVEGDLAPRLPWVIPGHQIVAEVVSSCDPKFSAGTRVGVGWMGGTDGTCRFCRSNRENLCDQPTYTGYSHCGGYAEYATAGTDFLIRLPDELDNTTGAPLLCAGIIGYRSMKVAEVKPGDRVGLFGFGSSAELLMQVLRSMECSVYVSTRDARHQQRAKELGAEWVGDAVDIPPHSLNNAITFAPVGAVVVAALKAVDKGGIVAINSIHLDHMPEFDYDSILWGERQLRSVANMTRQDADEFLQIASAIHLRPRPDVFGLDEANEALRRMKEDELQGPAVIDLTRRLIA